MFCINKVHLFEYQVYGASRIDVNKVYVSVVVNEFCTSCHSVGKAAFHLKTFKRQIQGNATMEWKINLLKISMLDNYFSPSLLRSWKKTVSTPARQKYLRFHAAWEAPTLTADPAEGLCTWPSLHRWCLLRSVCTHDGTAGFHTAQRWGIEYALTFDLKSTWEDAQIYMHLQLWEGQDRAYLWSPPLTKSKKWVWWVNNTRHCRDHLAVFNVPVSFHTGATWSRLNQSEDQQS